MEQEFSSYSDTLMEGTTLRGYAISSTMWTQDASIFDVTARSIKFLYFPTLNLYKLSFLFLLNKFNRRNLGSGFHLPDLTGD